MVFKNNLLMLDFLKLLIVPRVLQILKLLQEAVNAGFAAALTIDLTSVEGLLGLGDAHLAAGKLLAQSGNLATANIHWKQSSEAFMKASKFLEAGNLYYPCKFLHFNEASKAKRSLRLSEVTRNFHQR